MFAIKHNLKVLLLKDIPNTVPYDLKYLAQGPTPMRDDFLHSMSMDTNLQLNIENMG